MLIISYYKIYYTINMSIKHRIYNFYVTISDISDIDNN